MPSGALRFIRRGDERIELSGNSGPASLWYKGSVVTGAPLLGDLPHLRHRAPLGGGHDDADVLDAADELRQGFLDAGRDGHRAGTTYVVGLDHGAGGSTVAFLLAPASAGSMFWLNRKKLSGS